MPEWLLLVIALGLTAAVGALWQPLLVAVPLFVLAVGLTVFDAALSARRSWRGSTASIRTKLLTAFLFLAQPVLACGAGSNTDCIRVEASTGATWSGRSR